MITEIPLLPINAVLFPGGTLQMRITEERHLRLVTQVIASRKPLGVVLAALDGQKGREAVSVGCMGKITYWATEKPRVMEITLLGLQRFRTITGWRHANGFPMAWVLPVNKTHHAVDHGFFILCQRALQSFFDKTNDSPARHMGRFDDPEWVSFRLAEKLPLEVGTQQYLLQIEDTGRRLKALAMLAKDRVLLES